LTVDLKPAEVPPEPSHDALIPPIDMTVRTKWAGASVDWNGVEPWL
jgi:hypothetical protein